MIFILYFLENFPRRRILHRHNNECFLNLFGWTYKKMVVCSSQPSSWIISRALSNQNIIGLTNISIVLKPEPKRTTVCKRMEWVRGHFWNSSLMIGQKGQIWSTEKCFLRHFLVHTHHVTHLDKIFK